MNATKQWLSVLFILTVPMLWSCSADETLQKGGNVLKGDSTIYFSVSTDCLDDVATRNVSTRSEAFNSTEDFATDGRQFSVCAYRYREDIGEVLMIGSVDGNTITGATVTCDDDENWTTDEQYYWPQISHTVLFHAAYPVTTFIKTATDVTFPFDASTDDLGDPMMAYLAMSRSEASEYNYAAPLSFRHALSQLSFKAVTSVTGWTLTVRSITVHNLYNKGTIGIKTGGMKPTNLCLTTDLVTNPSVTFTVTDNQTDTKNVLPQSRKAWSPEFYTIEENNELTDTASVGTYIAIECALYDSSISGYKLGTGTDIDHITEYKTVYCPVDPVWCPNTRFSYTLDFKPPGYGTSAYNDDGSPIYDVASVSLTATAITDWSNGGSNTVHVK